MIFAFLEDGGVYTFDGADQAFGEFEGIDVESGIVCFFNEFGCPRRPVFDMSNEYGKRFWIFSWSKSGIYHLEADGNFEIEPLEMLLAEAQYLDESSEYNSLEDVRNSLSLPVKPGVSD